MGPHPSSLLVLVLCLAPAIHMQNRILPKPSIRAEPGPVIPRGQSVTIVCRGPAGAEIFRLEEKENPRAYWDEKIPSQHGSQWAEARFCININPARSYRCNYRKGPSQSDWSEPSEPLELKVTDEDVFTPLSGAPRVINSTPFPCTKPPTTAGTTPEVTLPPTGAGHQTEPPSQNYTVGNYVCIGLGGVVLLILVVIVAEAGHSWHRWPHGPQGWTQGRSCQKD